MYQSDWNSSAQTALINNGTSESHVFGDIEDACSDEMIERSRRKVAVEAGPLIQ